MSELRLLPVPAHGTEDVVVLTEGRWAGWVVTGTDDGSLWRVRPDGQRVELVAQTGGRPLGVELDVDGRLLVCDAHRGLLRVSPDDGTIEPVLDTVGGRRLLLCDNAAVGRDGTVWFSDSSRRYGLAEWRADLTELTCSGRLLRLDPDGHVSVVLDGLAFANGVSLAADESWVAVAETATRRVLRWWLTGEQAGRREVLVDDLPGYPDNLSRGSDGLLWIALPGPVVPALERLQRSPAWVRRAAGLLPDALQPAPERSVRVQAYDDAGRLVHDLDLDASRFHLVTGVREHDGQVWLGSLEDAAVGVHTL